MPAPRKVDREQVVALRAAGAGVRAIARRLGVEPSTISRIVRLPELEERVERERERLAASAPVGAGGPSQRAELAEGRSAAKSAPVWLLVRGVNWGFGARRGDAVVMRNFPPGLYLDVDEEVVAYVHRANRPQLVLGTGDPPGPVILSPLRSDTGGG